MSIQRLALNSLAISICILCGAANGQFFSQSGFGLVETVSNNGISAGSFGNPAGQYFLWDIENGAMNIGGVGAGGGVGGSPGVSDDGQYVCGVTLNPATGLHEMSRYEVGTGTWTPLGGLGSSSGSETSSGWGISGDGSTVVGLAWVNAGMTHAAGWQDGVGVIDLGSTNPGQSARANACDIDGGVVAGWQDGNGRQGAFWVDGQQTLIVDNNSQPVEEASEVSNNGKFIFGFGIAPGINGIGNAYRYNRELDEFELLPNLDVGGGRNMAVRASNHDGTIAVGGTWPFGVPASFGNGFIWVEGLGTMTPTEYFQSMNVKGIPSNYNFAFVSGISADGKWFVGWGGTGAIANQSWAVRISQEVLLGDVNLDGVVDLLDVAPFVDLIAGLQFQVEADINQDGEVNLLDVNPFVEILTGN